MLRVVTYHRIAAKEDHPDLHPGLISASPEQFDAQIRMLARHFAPVSLPQVLDAAAGGAALPNRAVLISFDDAYADFAQHAWPILKRYGAPAALFVATAYPGEPRRHFWWDRIYRAITRTPNTELALRGERLSLRSDEQRRVALRQAQKFIKALPHDEAMRTVDEICLQLGAVEPAHNGVLSWDELRRLAGEGVALAAHTRTHPLLTRVDPDEARAEIAGAQHDLEQQIGTAPPAFCYPDGAHNATTTDILADLGFRLAFTTLDGHNPDFQDALRLRRTNVTPRTTAGILRLRLSRLGGRLDQWRHRTRVLPQPAPSSGPRWAYVMSRFPKITETFILGEMLAQKRLGAEIEVFPLLRERQPVVHPEVAALVARAHFLPFLSAEIVRANLHFLRRAPARYLRTLAEVLRGTLGSANFFFGALGIFPKSVAFARTMQRQGITHVHAHFATHPAVAALIVHRLTGIPFSFTAHGSDLHVDQRMLAAKVEAAQFAVTISEFNRQVMLDHCGPSAAEKIHVVHCGVDVGLFAPPEHPRLPGPMRILSVGSLEEVKGQAFLIRACGKLAEMGVDFTCEIIGDGPQRSALERLIRDCGLAGRVRLAGPRQRHEVARALQQCDVMVLASVPTSGGKREGIPVSLMEAMACGLPVVASRLSGIPELIEDGVNGLLCAPRDVQALTAALLRLEDPALRARLGRAARARILQDFELTSNTRKLRSLIENGGPAMEADTPAVSEAVLT